MLLWMESEAPVCVSSGNFEERKGQPHGEVWAPQNHSWSLPLAANGNTCGQKGIFKNWEKQRFGEGISSLRYVLSNGSGLEVEEERSESFKTAPTCGSFPSTPSSARLWGLHPRHTDTGNLKGQWLLQVTQRRGGAG